MHISHNCIELVKHFEGLRQNLYTCIAGYRTIGYGHKLKPHEHFEQISHDQALELLHQDLELSLTCVLRNTKCYLSQHQLDALSSFVFNVGAAAFQRSTLRQKINYQELDKVECEMLKWVYVKARKVSGLVLRRKAEIELFYRC
jgi:GH24 family phage-related lysozyme (muramidase)